MKGIATSETRVSMVRLARPEADQLFDLIFSRYPKREWACFCQFGWRETPDGQLVLTLASLDPPMDGDLDRSVGHVAIQEPYSLRIALSAESHPLAVGIIHSHPENCRPTPSLIDDDMDGYYSGYFSDFAPKRPYVSLIASRIHGRITLSGRVFWKSEWYSVSRFSVTGIACDTWKRELPRTGNRGKLARLNAAFGDDTDRRLRASSVAVVGAGGTGSIAIEVLARAGIGRIIIADPDHLETSNLERVHGSYPADVAEHISKAELAARHVRSIDPDCQVEAYVGALPQSAIVDALVSADAVIGCTDRQHSRLALSDVSTRFLVPVIDCGVMLEGKGGRVTGQVVQLVRMLPSDPCVLCRKMTDPRTISEELMSSEERAARVQAAREAVERGQDANPYWQGLPQLNTVGYLTAIAGAFASAYVIGWITGTFEPPFNRLQMNIVAPFLDVQEVGDAARTDCICRRVRGWADQAAADALVSPPSHWTAPVRLS